MQFTLYAQVTGIYYSRVYDFLCKRSSGSLKRDPILKLNTKPIQRSLPGPNRHAPFLANISQCQVEQSTLRLFAWKRSTVLRDLAQARAHRLNGIGRVYHLANLRRRVKERNDALPVWLPALHNGRIVFAPHRFKLIQGF